MLRAITAAIILILASLSASEIGAQNDREPPYWASISADKAMMRTGPGRNYPATWLYVRADLPIRIVETYPNWRKVEDPQGTQGWMLVNLLSDTRTALVTGDEPRPMHENPKPDARIRFLAEPGVVGRLSRCADDWCHFTVRGREGYIRTDHIWGTDPGETF